VRRRRSRSSALSSSPTPARSCELAKRTDEVLELVGLPERAGDRTSKYSGRMKRRLNVVSDHPKRSRASD